MRSAPGGGLFAAAWWNDVENLELLIRAGARDRHCRRRHAVPRCLVLEEFDAAKVLALSGADVNYRDSKGGPPCAAWRRRIRRTAFVAGETRSVAGYRGSRWCVRPARSLRKRDKKFFEAMG